MSAQSGNIFEAPQNPKKPKAEPCQKVAYDWNCDGNSPNIENFSPTPRRREDETRSTSIIKDEQAQKTCGDISDLTPHWAQEPKAISVLTRSDPVGKIPSKHHHKNKRSFNGNLLCHIFVTRLFGVEAESQRCPRLLPCCCSQGSGCNNNYMHLADMLWTALKCSLSLKQRDPPSLLQVHLGHLY